MKKDTFNQAVESTQILLMLSSSKAFQQNKDLQKGVSALRSKLDEHVFTLHGLEQAWFKPDTEVVSGADKVVARLETFFKHFHTKLTQFTSELDMDKVLAGKSLIESHKDGKYHAAVMRKYTQDLADILADPMLKQSYAVRSVMRSDQLGVRRGESLHEWSSVIRNAPWLPSLQAVRVPMERALGLNHRLAIEHGSRVGATLYDEKKAQFLDANVIKQEVAAATTAKKTRAKAKPGVVHSSDIHVTVSLSDSLLTNDASLNKAVTALSKTAKGASAFAELWKDATHPVKVTLDSPTALADAANTKYSMLMEKVELQLDAIALETKKADVARQKKEEEAALKALATLGPHLKVLRKNPELLKKVMSELSPDM